MTSRIIRARPALPPADAGPFNPQRVRKAVDVQAVRFDTLNARRSETAQTAYHAHFLTIPNGRAIVTETDIFYLDQNGNYFPDYYPKPWVYQAHLQQGGVLEIACGQLPEHEVPGPAFAPFLVAGNWFHTLLDNYARLYYFEFLDSPNLNVIIPAWAMRPEPAFQEDARLVNAIFMANRKQMLLAPGIYQFDQLILPPLANQNDYLVCAPLEYISATLRAALAPKPAVHRARLFISRADIAVRNLSNEPELLDALRPLGIMPICPGDYSFRTQLEIFAGAELLLGVHGQGFTPMVCARGCRHVMEFEAANWDHTAYRSIASCFDIPYQKLPAKMLELRDIKRFDWLAEADIAATVEQVAAVLK